MAFIFLLHIVYVESKKGTIGSKITFLITLVVGGGMTALFWILTTDVAISLRDELLSKYSFLNSFYDNLMTSYTDYGTYRWQEKTRHWHPEDISNWQYIFGKGVWPIMSDIGYIKNIYASGVLGTLMIVITYVASYFSVKTNILQSGESIAYKKNYIALYGFVVLAMLAMESKISILLSSTSFELLSILFISEIVFAKRQSHFLFYQRYSLFREV